MDRPRDYFLATERLGFHHWTLADLPLALALWTNPEVTRLLGGPFSVQHLEARLRHEIALERSSGVQYWPIFFRSSGEHVGCAGLWPCHQTSGIYELGFHLLPAWWNKGLAQEAARAVIGYAFGTAGARGLSPDITPKTQRRAVCWKSWVSAILTTKSTLRPVSCTRRISSTPRVAPAPSLRAFPQL